MTAISIIEQEFAAVSLERAKKEYPKFEQYWERGLSWVLARKPEIGINVPNTKPPRYVWGVNPWKLGGIPRMVIVYTYDGPTEPIVLERITFYE